MTKTKITFHRIPWTILSNYFSEVCLHCAFQMNDNLYNSELWHSDECRLLHFQTSDMPPAYHIGSFNTQTLALKKRPKFCLLNNKTTVLVLDDFRHIFIFIAADFQRWNSFHKNYYLTCDSITWKARRVICFKICFDELLNSPHQITD